METTEDFVFLMLPPTLFLIARDINWMETSHHFPSFLCFQIFLIARDINWMETSVLGVNEVAIRVFLIARDINWMETTESWNDYSGILLHS